MWYAIFIILGLSLGIGMMIWALRERSKRFAAEKKMNEEVQYRLKAEQVADTNRESLERVLQDLDKANNTIKKLYQELEDVKNMLIKCGDAKALKDWLSSELKGGVI
jgi:hypothetical protein